MVILFLHCHGSQREILNAVKEIAQEEKKEKFLQKIYIDENYSKIIFYTKDLPPVDLLIRISGEVRISNFTLANCLRRITILDIFYRFSKKIIFTMYHKLPKQRKRFE